MKKQIVSFFALFGLVLVLSVYYVLLPTNLFIKGSTTVNSNSNVLADINMTIEQSSNLYFATLEDKLLEKHEAIIYECESVVASSSYLNEEKEVAINRLNNQKRIMESESNLVSLILQYGYYNAYVEYQEDIIKVIVQSNSMSNEQAAELISVVLDNAINDLYPELSYVE